MTFKQWWCGGALAMGLLISCTPTREEAPPSSTPPPSLSLVKDINLTVDTKLRPQQLLTVGSTTFFTAFDSATGVELWKTDGTEAGTVLVKDLVPGTASSHPRMLGSAGGTLFFSIPKGPPGTFDYPHQLWKSDGTEAGTVWVADITGTGGDLPSPIAGSGRAAGRRFFFETHSPGGLGTALVAYDGTRLSHFRRFYTTYGEGRSLEWKLNRYVGSVNGWLFTDESEIDHIYGEPDRDKRTLEYMGDWGDSTLRDELLLPPPGQYPAQGSEFAVVGDSVFFRRLMTDRVELWRTDTTQAGTMRVKDVEPFELTVVGGMLFFQARDAQGDLWLWKSDGTEAGTVPVKVLPPSKSGLGLTQPRAVGTTLFFLLDDATTGLALWKSDGTEAGTGPVRSLPSAPSQVQTVGTLLFLLLGDTSNGLELWKSDGTPVGTSRVKALRQAPSELKAVGGLLFFTFDDGVTGLEVWRSDGTEEGTRLVRDLEPGAAGSGPSLLTDANGTLLFLTHENNIGVVLWKSDGTEAGTVRLRSLPLPKNSAFVEPIAQGGCDRAIVNEAIFFSAYSGTDGTSSGLWRSDGSSEGTVPVGSLNRLATTPQPIFHLRSSLWKSDGTEAGTVPLNTVVPAFAPVVVQWLRNLPGGSIFRGWVYQANAYEYQLWKTDGTETGSVLLMKGPEYRVPKIPMAELDGTLLMALPESGANTTELWRTNGTVEGTVRVKAFDPKFDIVSWVRSADGKTLLFILSVPGALELWRTDGTEAGTVRLMGQLPGGSYGLSPPLLVGELAFFVTNGGGDSSGQTLWRSNGTVEGTVRLRNFETGLSLGALTSFGGKLYFWADAKAGGTSLWTSDGTEAGTRSLGNFTSRAKGTDTCPDVNVGWPSLNGQLFFGADDGVSGLELWRTDGTVEETRLVTDVIVGEKGSGALPVATFDGKIVFVAASSDSPDSRMTWVTDGTQAGTVLLQEEGTGRRPSDPYGFVQVGSRLLFRASTPDTGRELWKLEPHTSP